jgi:protocatechuate 3,4-dioxygenase beta subunit
MARSSQKWSKSGSGRLWLPEPNRRSVIAGGAASAAALLLGCGGGSGGSGMGPSPEGRGSGGAPGTAGSRGGTAGAGPAGTGGAGPAGTGGGSSAADAGGASDAAAGTGGAKGTGGAMGTGGASGSDAAASDTGNGGNGGMMASDAANTPSAGLKCTRRGEQIVGPFPASSVQLNRSDIRSDPANGNAVKPGVPLRLVIKVGKGSASACTPMANAVVNVWQCDAAGVYSAYASQGSAGKQFLRGYQTTDSTGTVEFVTIYPGSYSGRCVHIHFSVRMSPTVSFPSGGFVSQLYFPDEVTDEVLTQPGYNARGRTRNAQDGYYRRDVLVTPTKMAGGWLAELELAV